ncbi:MAG: hypothetical protein CMK09_09190 [Ponticaulis sp.]|nr:hypothetical protein [Ponticaulis sp.]|tara:strand:- start:6665 stop:7621 length:957 start_codon:yes stop_codon:yes gene_type:complete
MIPAKSIRRLIPCLGLIAAVFAAPTALAQQEEPVCPANIKERMDTLQAGVMDRLNAGEQNPDFTPPPITEDPLVAETLTLLDSCGYNRAVQRKLTDFLVGIAYDVHNIQEKAQLADLAYASYTNAEFAFYACEQDNPLTPTLCDTSDESRSVLADLRETLPNFIWPTMFQYALTGNSYPAFSLEMFSNCPYPDDDVLVDELNWHARSLKEFVDDPQIKRFAVGFIPLNYRADALRRVCPNSARSITIAMAENWALLAERALDNPDLPFPDGSVPPSSFPTDIARDGLVLLDALPDLPENAELFEVRARLNAVIEADQL